MRIPRSLLLIEPSGSVHKIWRCHNREFLLADPQMKNLYLRSTAYALEHKSVEKNVSISCYCIMSNHSHMGASYTKDSSYFSNFMRIAHGKFGQIYNQINMTSGKVANERPKTPPIQDIEHEMRVQFYIEANPIRAGFRNIENLKNYKYSSYGFYAYGLKTEWTKLLTIPKWYIELGNTPKERQKAYRILFSTYLNESRDSESFLGTFIGNAQWVTIQKQELQNLILSSKFGPSP